MAIGAGGLVIGLIVAAAMFGGRKRKPVASPGVDDGMGGEPWEEEPFTPSDGGADASGSGGGAGGGGGGGGGNVYAPFVNAKAAQEAIQALGFYIGESGADGDFGTKSRQGLRNFKRFAVEVMQWDGPALNTTNGNPTPASMAALSAAADMLIARKWTFPGPEYSGKPTEVESDGVVGAGWFDWPRKDLFGESPQNFARALQTLGYVSYWGNLSSTANPTSIEPSKYAGPVKRFQADYNRVAGQKGWKKLGTHGNIDRDTVKAMAFALKVSGDQVDANCRPGTLSDSFTYEGDTWTCTELWDAALWEMTGGGRS